MRQSLSVLILLFGTSAASELAAQDVYFGALAGPNFSDIAWTPDPEFEVTNKTALGGGVFVGFDINDLVALEARAVWVRNSLNLDVAEAGLEASAVVQADYLSVPLLAKLRLGGDGIRPFLVAGPELGFKTGARLRVSALGVEEDDPDFDESTASQNFSLDIGGGVEIPVGRTSLILEGLYAHGLKDLAVDPDSDTQEVKTRSLRLSAGLRF